jgi:hypothetical protein
VVEVIYYRIKAKEESSAKQIIRTLKNSFAWAKTNGNPLEIYSATGSEHTKHIPEIATRFNADVEVIEPGAIPQEIRNQGGIPKREYIAFDGQVFTDKMIFLGYERNNNPAKVNTRKERWKNILNKGVRKERKPRATKTDVVARLEPNQDFNLTGAINSLKILEDKLLQAYNDVAELRPKLEQIQEIEKLLKDKEDYLKSAKIILNSVG